MITNGNCYTSTIATDSSQTSFFCFHYTTINQTDATIDFAILRNNMNDTSADLALQQKDITKIKCFIIDNKNNDEQPCHRVKMKISRALHAKFYIQGDHHQI